MSQAVQEVDAEPYTEGETKKALQWEQDDACTHVCACVCLRACMCVHVVFDSSRVR